MRGSSNWVWAFVGLGFGVLGLVSALMFRERPATAATHARPGDAGDAAILQLVEEVRLLREAIESHPQAQMQLQQPQLAPPSRLPVGNSAELMNTWFAQLDQRLALLAQSSRSDAASRALPVVLPGADFQPHPFPAREEISTQDFSKRHIFWSYQQVVDAYGVPNEISTNPHGSQIWVYDDGDASLEFVFRDGFVLRAEW